MLGRSSISRTATYRKNPLPFLPSLGFILEGCPKAMGNAGVGRTLACEELGGPEEEEEGGEERERASSLFCVV